MSGLFRWVHAFGVAIDYGAAMLLWLHVQAPMTISSHCGLCLRDPGAYPPVARFVLGRLGRLLNGIEPGHCEAAIRADLARCETSVKLLGG